MQQELVVVLLSVGIWEAPIISINITTSVVMVAVSLCTICLLKVGVLPGSVAEFTTLQFKYADIATIDHQIQYNVYWVQTFKTLGDLEAYLDKEGLTYEK